jgi:hypothetical protein
MNRIEAIPLNITTKIMNYENLTILKYRICKYGIYHVYAKNEEENLLRLFVCPKEFSNWYDTLNKTNLSHEPYENVLALLKQFYRVKGSKIWYTDIYKLYD